MTVTTEQLDELERLHAAASPAPWASCGADRGGCQCGLVWFESDSEDADFSLSSTVAKALTNANDDDIPSVPDETMRANAMLIAKLRNALPELIAAARLQLKEGT